MSGFGLGLIMFLCLVPVIWIMFLYMYPKKWKDHKLVLGVNNRPEFKTGPAADEVEQIVHKSRKQALCVAIVCTAIAAVLLPLKGLTLKTFIWTGFILIALSVFTVPFIIGHREMMAVKRKLGIGSDKGINYIDLKTAGNIHALKAVTILIPNAAGLAVVVLALLTDLKLISFSVIYDGGFTATIVMGTYWLAGLLITFGAYIVDNMKNTVISADSDVNANYNRAKKKNLADMSVAFLWLNTIYLMILYLMLVFGYSDMLMMISIGIYLAVIMTEMVIFVRSNIKIDERYQKEIALISDDDEYWLGGLLYYNPTDRRLMVEKHAGIGSTINMAHPGGKIISVLLVISLVFTLLSVIWIGMLESTPLSLRIDDGKLVCHQLRDEYVIPFDDIAEIEYGEDMTKLRMSRTAGVGMDTLLKGDFYVEGVNGCKVFLAPAGKAYIHIVTVRGKHYYISGSTSDDTRRAFEELRVVGVAGVVGDGSR